MLLVQDLISITFAAAAAECHDEGHAPAPLVFSSLGLVPDAVRQVSLQEFALCHAGENFWLVWVIRGLRL